MPDPTPTTRDHAKARALAQAIVGDVMVAADEGYTVALECKSDVLGGWTETLEEALAQARREGWEEGLREAAYVAHQEAAHLEHYLDDIHQSDGARKAEKAIRALVTSPSGAEE